MPSFKVLTSMNSRKWQHSTEGNINCRAARCCLNNCEEKSTCKFVSQQSIQAQKNPAELRSSLIKYCHGYISPDDRHYFSLKRFNSGHIRTHTQKKEKRLTVRFIKLVLSTKTKQIQVNSLLIMYHFLRSNRSGGKISWLNWEGRFAGSRCHTQSYTLMLCSDQVTPGVTDGISRFPVGLQFLHSQY